MKHAEKNEVDLMLRNLGRQQRALPAQENLSAHLDVDEMSAYAEDALPAAARARYTSHLADCNDCRKVVASLAVAAGAPLRNEVEAKPARQSFWQTVGKFLSPAVLRYAVPAVILFGVITIGLITLRQPQQESRVALNTEALEPAPVEPASSYDPQEPVEQATGKGQTSGSSDAAQSARVAEQPRSGETKSATPPPAPAPASADGAGAGTGAVASAPPPQPSYASDPDEGKRSSAAKPTETVSEETERKARDDRSGNEVARARSETDKAATAKDERAQQDASTTTQAQNQPMAGRAMRRMQTLEAKKEKRDEGASRTVAGRRFRRENNMWVDAAYGAGTSLTSVRRGTEQFRALLADEPGLRTVSEELGGTVIVVWKGRAYKIQ